MQPHPLHPPDALLAWLERQTGTLHLPVVIQTSPLGISHAVIGTDAAALSQPGAIAVWLNDTRLGTSLHDRLRALGQAEVYAVWMVGTWGQRVALFSDGPTLTVARILRPIAPGEPAQALAAA